MAAIRRLPIFWAIALILPATLLAAPAILRSRNWLTNSITATAAAASAWAKAGPALPDFTAFRKAMKRSIAARIRWIAPHAATRPWMIAITAPAAGTIMLTRRSTRIAISAAGIADLIASQAILPTWAIVIPPLVSRFQTDLPRPSRDSTLSLNHCEMA